MAIPAPNQMTTVDTLPSLEEVQFTIGDPRWVMKALADLYSNRELAVAREYSTNAHDEHVKFGVKRPIEVSLPTLMDPFFRVRDFAEGMSREVLTEVYTRFGDSSKRDSNKYNGMLGFGSKAAIAYTTSFKVTSWHKGVKTIGLVYKNDDEYIMLKVIAQVKSDEPSGVEVEVPVHNHEEFSHKARDFYKFWLPGRVLVDGAEPQHAVGEEITPGLYYSDEYDTSYVVMGNVAYRIANPAALFRNSDMSNINFVAYVENGEVEFTPSREDLKYTDLTKNTLHKVIGDFEKQIKATAQAEIDNAADHADAYAKWVKWCNRLGSSMFADLKFGNDTLVNTFKIDAQRYAITGYRSRYNTHHVDRWQVAWSENTLFVTDVTGDITSNHKRKAKDWNEFKGRNTPSYILFTKASSVDSPWVDKDNVVSWTTIKKELPRNYGKTPGSGVPSRIPGSFDIITRNGRKDEQQIPATGDVFWVSATRARNKYSTIVNALDHLKNDGTVIILGENRQPKFKRENPNVQEFFAWATTHVEKDATKYLTDEAKEALDIGGTTKRWLEKLDTAKCDDPEVARLKSLVDRVGPLTKTYKEVIALAQTLGVLYNVKTYNSRNIEFLSKRYPLLDQISIYYGRQLADDIYLYMNAAYAVRKDA